MLQCERTGYIEGPLWILAVGRVTIGVSAAKD